MQPNPKSNSFEDDFRTKADFERLFRKYYQNLCSYVFYFLKDHAAAEEVVQDVFFALWQKRDELKITSSVKSYLYKAARNHSLNVLKHIEVRENYKQHNERLRAETEAGEEGVLETKELQKRIENAINQLPPERKRIFVMSRYEDLKYREIADELGISVKTVEAQMGKALRFLREQLVDYLPLWLYVLLFFER